MEVKNIKGMIEDEEIVELLETEHDVMGRPSGTPDPVRAQLDEIVDLLKDDNNPPSIVDMEGWKDLYGQINISSVLGDHRLYIWRVLRRPEYRSIAESGAMSNEDRYQDAVIRKCMLYPQPTVEWMREQPAGVVPTLFKQIMYKTGFVPEEMALALINTI